MTTKPYSTGETIAVIFGVMGVVAFFGLCFSISFKGAEKANSFKRELACIESGRNFTNGICK